MAKIKSIRINKRDPKTNTTLVDFMLDIKATAQGMFTATFPDEITAKLKELNVFDRYHKGTMEAETLSKLEAEINRAISYLTQYEVIEDVHVIKYSIGTACNYSKTTDGKYFPHSAFENEKFSRDEHGNPLWICGTEKREQHQPGDYHVSITCGIRRKITNKYLDGTIKTYYTYADRSKLGINGKWVHELIGMGTGSYCRKIDDFKEIEYTEENALFFRKFVTGIFTINEYVAKIKDTDQLRLMIKNNIAIEGV